MGTRVNWARGPRGCKGVQLLKDISADICKKIGRAFDFLERFELWRLAFAAASHKLNLLL